MKCHICSDINDVVFITNYNEQNKKIVIFQS